MNFPNYEQIETPNISIAFAKILLVCKMSFFTEAHQGKQRPVLLLCGHDGHHPCGLRYSLCDAKHCLVNWWCTQCTNQTFILFILVSLDCSRLDGRGRTILFTIYTWNYHIWYGSVQTYSSPDVLMWLRSVWWRIRSNTTKDWQIIYQIAEKYVYNWARRKLASVLVWVDARLLEPPHAGIVLAYLGCCCTARSFALDSLSDILQYNNMTGISLENSCRYAGCLIGEQ